MKTITIALLICLISLTTVFSQENVTQDVIVKIINFDTDNGKAFIGLYNSEETFMKKDYKSSISKIENKACTVTFKNVPVGTYAVSLFHDENGNGKMDTNMFGIPKEDYGSSNDAKGLFGPPKWADAKFEVSKNTVNLTIKL